MLKIIPLGGLGEIGLNMMAIEHGPYILVVDAGLMFPDDFLPGVDLVIPDFRFLLEAKERVGAIILTHAHEDHIGAMPFFLREFNVPVYGTGFTLEILKEKLREYRLLERADLRKVTPGQTTDIGPFTVEYIRVNHSTIEGVGLAIRPFRRFPDRSHACRWTAHGPESFRPSWGTRGSGPALRFNQRREGRLHHQ
jgi:ribonuclease J